MQKLMTARDVAEAFGISEHTLANWRTQKTGPTYIRVGGCIRYSLGDLENWLESRKTKTTDAPKSEKRELALPILVGRPRVARKSRLGGYRTQQDRRNEIRNSLGDQEKR